MMKARRDVPPYLSWVFPLQTLLQCVKDRGQDSISAIFPSSSPLSFLFNWIPRPHSFVFRQGVTQSYSNTYSPSTDRQV